MEVKIRKASKSDYPTVYECMTNTAWNDVPEAEKATTKKEVWMSFFRKIAKTLTEGKGRKIFVACDDENDFMGYVVTGNMGEGASTIPVGMVFDISVMEPFRRRGIAKLLIRAAEDYCRQQGMWRIKLEVAANNPKAIDLYKKVGFEPERTLMGKNLS
jgi:ribosomal protein S18 acetylase RimI-like enzyme